MPTRSRAVQGRPRELTRLLQVFARFCDGWFKEIRARSLEDMVAKQVARRRLVEQWVTARETALASKRPAVVEAVRILDELEACEALYRLFGNPLWVFHALSLVPPDWPLPSWVRDYLHTTGTAITANPPHRDAAAAVGKLLGFGGAKGPSDAKRLKREERDFGIVMALLQALAQERARERRTGERGKPLEEIFADVASETKVGYQTVFDVYYAHFEARCASLIPGRPPRLLWKLYPVLRGPRFSTSE
jgi:hypothetical protein